MSYRKVPECLSVVQLELFFSGQVLEEVKNCVQRHLKKLIRHLELKRSKDRQDRKKGCLEIDTRTTSSINYNTKRGG